MLRKRSNKSSAAEIASISSPSVSRNNSQNGGSSSSGPRYFSTAGSGENASSSGGRRTKAIPPPPLNLGLADFNSELCRTVLGLVLTQNGAVRLRKGQTAHIHI